MTSDDITNDGASTNRRRRPRTRRSVLALGAASLSAGVSGCSAIRGDLPGIGSSDSSVFEEISFEGQHMVVQLREGHSVKRLNLIAPDGSVFDNSSLSEGQTTAKIQLLRISDGDPRHYSQGKYKLIGVQADSNVVTKIQLQPSLSIESVNQFDGNQTRDQANVSVKVRNSGSAPTWIYNIFYEGVPNEEAEKKTANKGEPTLDLIIPKSDANTILSPDESRAFVSYEPPLLSQDKIQCGGESIRGKVFVKAPILKPVSSQFKATPKGERVSVGTSDFTKRYTCTEYSMQLLDGGDSDG